MGSNPQPLHRECVRLRAFFLIDFLFDRNPSRSSSANPFGPFAISLHLRIYFSDALMQIRHLLSDEAIENFGSSCLCQYFAYLE